MMSINLKLEPLTADAFSPFGDVIDIEQSGTTETINYGLNGTFREKKGRIFCLG